MNIIRVTAYQMRQNRFFFGTWLTVIFLKRPLAMADLRGRNMFTWRPTLIFLVSAPCGNIACTCNTRESACVTATRVYMWHHKQQCCGSMKFWLGSGSADPFLWLMVPDPDLDPAIFVSNLQDAKIKKKNFLFIVYFFSYYFWKVHFSYYFCSMIEGSGSKKFISDPELPGGSGMIFSGSGSY